ncbi:MAG: hypothetical protein N0C90_13810 [Candidatus Thiodiazotropha endolucinida]|nr:hypothetical protein [Candidatus Thiodiazotropha taylori]MCW4262439.1 hypothetical protein [Candidatus Thiodiazotropha endolucinida]
MASKGGKAAPFGWHTVRGRQRPRYTGKIVGAQQGCKPKQKRQRTSTGSGSGNSPVCDKSSFDNDSDLSINDFKNFNIDEKLDTIFTCLREVKATNQRLLNAEQIVHEIRETTLHNSERIDILAYKSLDLEARQRRNNLIFWGIPEVISENCLTVLSEFLTDKLELDSESICIQRAHRVGKPLNPRRTYIGQAAGKRNHRPLIALFRDYQDVELILSNTTKLKGSSFGINRDYPPEIVSARKTLFQEKKALKSANPNSRVSIQYPAKLMKDGHLVKDMFPKWHELLRKSRLENPNVHTTSTNIQSDRTSNTSDDRVRLVGKRTPVIEQDETVFQTDFQSDSSDMEHSADDRSVRSLTATAEVHTPRETPHMHPSHRGPTDDITTLNTNTVTKSAAPTGRPPTNNTGKLTRD